MRILGTMSGSSLDGLDIGVIEIKKNKSKWEYKIINPITYPYSDEWIQKLRNAHKLKGEDLIRLDFKYAELCSQYIYKYNKEFNEKYSCISYHGHTVFHNPHERYTFQVGRPSTIAALCKVKVVADFRSTDVSLSGQGAPLMAILDKLIFNDYKACINLGGICNVASLADDSIVAYDIAPCNQLLNALANKVGKQYDRNGEIALRGVENSEIMEMLQEDEYYKLPFPKSLDNNYIQNRIIKPLLKSEIPIENKMRSCIEFISSKISESINSLKSLKRMNEKDTVLFTGGGALNPVLKTSISIHLQNIGIVPIFPSKTLIEYKELLLMGILAYLRLENKSNVLAQFTGASQDSISGAVYEG